MTKLKWIIDANILGNVCRKNADNDITRKFLTQVKEHFVLINKEVIDEYRPMPGRKNLQCEGKDTTFLKEWIIELITKFGYSIRHKNLPEVPLCVSRLVGTRRFKEKDCIYVRLAIFSEDKLLVASETHFQNIKSCLEGNYVHMFDENKALEHMNHSSR